MKWPFFSQRKSSEGSQAEPDLIKVAVQQAGAVFLAESVTEQNWLHGPLAFGPSADRVLLLDQLEEEGLACWHDNDLLLPWSSFYEAAASPEYGESLSLLGLQPVGDWRPILCSRGSLSDADFSIVLTGWVDAQGRTASGNFTLTGAQLETGDTKTLLSATAWKTVAALAAFHARPQAQRNSEFNRIKWARIRRLAIEARADLSDFLKKTIILTPEKLEIQLRKVRLGDSLTLEVIPGFEDAPKKWLGIFDRVPLIQDHYDIPEGEGLTHIILSPEVKTVLGEIKRMPGRRVSGSRAEAFVRNPFALLGIDAEKVIEPAQFEAARDQAGISFARFTAEVLRDEYDFPYDVAILVEEFVQGEIKAEKLPFEKPEDLDRFISKLEFKIEQGAQCCFWEGYDLEILGDTADQLALLKSALHDIRHAKSRQDLEVFDLSHYSDRIQCFGVEPAYYSPFIARKNDGDGWFPENVLFAMGYTPAGATEPAVIPFTQASLEQLRERLQQARVEGMDSFTFPGAPKPMLVTDAERILSVFQNARVELLAGTFQPQKPEPGTIPVKRQGLVVKANLDQIDYEERRGELAPPAGAEPSLPRSLKASITLKQHQKSGLVWLQHLWSKSPAECRGALLADDMGLGKTIQLLAFIASCLEKEPDSDPFLVVAPVSLLENWKEEIDKFFVPQAFSILLLYGRSLAEKRLSQKETSEVLLQAGVGKLLRHDWLGNAKVVLTTYETLRDLEFSLAMQRWSAIICDEAQKIKNPNAMVTRAAKKQNARFRIACTGTPVENTLTDLWCLFDFIQPGLLQSLNAFGTHYRRPIEAETDEERARVGELRTIINPQTMRRTKAEVATDLPRKIEVKECQQLKISDHQRNLYAQAISQFRMGQKAGGKNTGRQSPLGLLQYLRQLCSDPRETGQLLAQESLGEIENNSPKMAWLLNEIEKIKQKNDKVIIFCEFRDLQRHIQKCIAGRFQIVPDIINGDTSVVEGSSTSRQKRIQAFQQKQGFGLIILSPLAVGFGVNIQAANHVIHFTRSWNPAKEDQATDRAYRIGQTKDVFVYYLVVVADDFTTFDAKLHRLLEQKRALSNDMLNGTGDVSSAEFQDFEGTDGELIFAAQPIIE